MGKTFNITADCVYEYTSGYPFLVSKLCKLIDEEITGTDKFKEEDGRRYFLLYLRPIINGTGNYYIESRTRNMERTDVIVDYRGEQFII